MRDTLFLSFETENWIWFLRHYLKFLCELNFIGQWYGAPFVKILYLTDLAQKLLSLHAEMLSLAQIAISACRDVISARDSYHCMQRCYL